MSTNLAQINPNTLICDQCGAANYNLASEGLSHAQEANEVKGHEACDGVWRLAFPQACSCVVIERERDHQTPLYYIQGQTEGVSENPFVKGLALIPILLRDFCPHRA